MTLPVEITHGVLRCVLSSAILQNCNRRQYVTALLVAAGVRLAPTVAAAGAAAHILWVGNTERYAAGMMRRAFEVAPDGVDSIAVGDLDSSAECAQALDDVIRTQPNSIRVVQVDADTPGPCAKLMRVCATWGPTSLRDLSVVARPPRGEEADPTVIEEALTHCTGGLKHLRVPLAAVLTPAYARSIATAPPAWMATVRLLSVAITSNSDLGVLAEAPRLLPSLIDLALCMRTENLSAAAWRSALQALLPQLTAFSVDGPDASLADPSIFANWWDHPASGDRATRRPRSGDDDRTASDDAAPASAPTAVVATFPLEKLQINFADVCHGPLLSLVAAHAPNLNDVVIAGASKPGMIDALVTMPRCRSLTLFLRGLTDEHIARILRGGMRNSLRNCWVADNAFGFVSTFGSRQTLFSDIAAFDGVVCPKVRKAALLPYNDCTRSVFPNVRWPEEITAASEL
jgi:hypothetical protein